MNNYYEKNNEFLEPDHVDSQNMQEIYSFLESVKPTLARDRGRGVNRNKPNEIINEEKEKSKYQKAMGLNDNIQADYEYKNKARKGLQYLLYKMSGGNVCKNITEYYKELCDKISGENAHPSRKDIKRSTENNTNSNSKNLRRQNLFDKFSKRDSVKSEEVFKLNFNKTDKGLNKNSGLPQGIIPKKRNKKKKSRINTFIPFQFYKKFESDLREEELKYFYSDKEIEQAKQKFVSKNPKKNKSKGHNNIKNLVLRRQTENIEEEKDIRPFLRLNTRSSLNNAYPCNSPLKDFQDHKESKFPLKHSKTKLSFIKYNIINSNE